MKRTLIVAIALVVFVGCAGKRGKNGSVSGTIHYKGKPVNGAMLRLHPVSGEGADFPVPVSQEGTFTGADIPPGEYKIVVESQEIPPESRMTAEIPPGMDKAKAEEMKQKFQQSKGEETPTIPYPNKYKDVKTTDLTCTITQGKQEKLTLELKD